MSYESEKRTRTTEYVVLAHGIRQLRAKSQMEPLAQALEAHGIPVHYANYGYVLIPTTNERAVRAITNATRDGEDLVCFSNAAWGGVVAIEKGLKVRHLFLISPALNADYEFPGGIETITVFYTPSDKATPMGKAWRQVTRILPWRWKNPHGWGQMGTTGPTRDDPRLVKIMLVEPVGHGWNKHWETVRRITTKIYRVRGQGA